MNETMERRFEEIEALAVKEGLDFFPIVYEEVPQEIIWDISSYGLPTRISHWSFGRSYIHQKYYGEMGLSKVYELIINNNPSYAFLDITNADVVNLLICAHCLGHSDFFKNNMCFSKTNRNMVNQAERNAKVIDLYKARYGVDAVEDWMDIAFALDGHIDWSMGEDRGKYPEPEQVFKVIKTHAYADIHGDDATPTVREVLKNTGLPPYPERDLLFFLTNYTQMLPWQKEILSIIRSEAYYFAPQFITKIMNEGWASYWHAELMYKFELTPEEHMEFSKAHSGVVNPGPAGYFNPYYVGFRIFRDLKERWDKAYEEGLKDAAFQKSGTIDQFDDTGNLVLSKKNGTQKIFEVRSEDDDVSFIHNYLTKDLMEDMKMFTFGYRGRTDDPDTDDLILRSRSPEEVRNTITEKLNNNGAPVIFITDTSGGVLKLQHDEGDDLPLNRKYSIETLKYIQKVWNATVILTTKDRYKRKQVYSCSGSSIIISSEGEEEEISYGDTA